VARLRIWGCPEGSADRELRFSTRKEVEAAIRRRLSSKNRTPAFTRGDQERFVIDAPQTRLTRLHQLDSIFAIFGSVLGSKPLYFRVGQVENRL
jgi:hypothetical protein